MTYLVKNETRTNIIDSFQHVNFSIERTEEIDLTGTWVLEKAIVNGEKLETIGGGTQIDTLFFSGKNFRQVPLVSLSKNQTAIGIRTATFEISKEKLELKNLKSQTNQTITTQPDETIPIKIKKNRIVIERPITLHGLQNETEGTVFIYYKKVQ